MPSNRTISARLRLSIDGEDEDDGIENGKNIISPPPTHSPRQYAANNQPYREPHRLPTSHGRKSRVPPRTGGQTGSYDADGGRQAEGYGNTGKGAEEKKLHAVPGEAGRKGEDTLQATADEVHWAAANGVGDGTKH